MYVVALLFFLLARLQVLDDVVVPDLSTLKLGGEAAVEVVDASVGAEPSRIPEVVWACSCSGTFRPTTQRTKRSAQAHTTAGVVTESGGQLL